MVLDGEVFFAAKSTACLLTPDTHLLKWQTQGFSNLAAILEQHGIKQVRSL